MGQPPVMEMIRFTEEWWGDAFDQALIERISAAPFDHLDAFRDDWPFHYVCDGLEYPELRMFDLPELAPGELRPGLTPRARGVPSGLGVLLYSDSVVVSSGLAAPFTLSGRYWEEMSREEAALVVVAGFQSLLTLKPLVEQKLVYFTNLDARPPFDAYFKGADSGLFLERALRRRYPEISDADVTVILGATHSHGQLIQLAAGRQLSLVAQSNYDHELFFNASKFAWKFIAGRDDWRPRAAPARDFASTLVRVMVPSFEGSTDTIAALRRDDAIFNEWRACLRTAVAMVGDLSSDPAALDDARAILGKEVEIATAELIRRLRRQASPSWLSGGWRGFAVGASTALATSSNPDLNGRLVAAGLEGLVDGVARVAEAIWDSKAQRAQARLLDTLVYSFKKLGSSGTAHS